jgi:hypothetical protein
MKQKQVHTNKYLHKINTSTQKYYQCWLGIKIWPSLNSEPGHALRYGVPSPLGLGQYTLPGQALCFAKSMKCTSGVGISQHTPPQGTPEDHFHFIPNIVQKI